MTDLIRSLQLRSVLSYNPERRIAFIRRQIDSLNEYLETSGTITKEQFEETADEIKDYERELNILLNHK